MKHLEFIAARIVDANLALIGVDLFIGTIPADVNTGVMLRDPLTGHEIDEGMEGWFHSRFQVILRDPDPAVGYARAEAIAAAITCDRVETATLFVNKVRPLTKPVSFPAGDSGEIETAFQVSIAFGEK